MPDDSTETQPDPRLQDFLDRLSKPAPGHTDPKTGIVKPKYVQDEIQNKLQAVVELKYKDMDEAQRKEWELAAMSRLIELYPKEVFRDLFDGTKHPRIQRTLAHLKPHLETLFGSEHSE